MPRHRRPTITRRGLIRGGVAIGATAGVVSLVSTCTNRGQQVSNPVVVDAESGTDVLEEYDYNEDDLEPAQSYTLDLGSVLRPAEGTWIPYLVAGRQATPVVQGRALNIQTGESADIVPTPITRGSNYEIYDIRCSDQVFAWVEMNIISHDWKLYAQTASNGSLTGSSMTLWEADSNWDPPAVAVSGNRVLWQVQPASSGNQTRSTSNCYLWKSGDSEAQTVCKSEGRFGCDLSISGNNVCLVPRVQQGNGTYYGITAYTLDNDLKTQIDQLVLPQSVRPMNVTRIQDNFAFAIEASYDEGSLLSQMGTYIGHGEGPFAVVKREPAAVVAGKDSSYIVKVRTSYYLINTADESYRVIPAYNRALDFGEYPARTGSCDTFVTFSTVKDPNTGYPASVRVRTFTL